MDLDEAERANFVAFTNEFVSRDLDSLVSEVVEFKSLFHLPRTLTISEYGKAKGQAFGHAVRTLTGHAY